MKALLCLGIFSALLLSLPASRAADLENPYLNLSWEICPKSNVDGTPCKGSVTRTGTGTAGYTYKCSNGHTFMIKPKIGVSK